MSIQITIDFEAVHQRENNYASEAFLQQHRERFNSGCWALLMGMLKGIKYSTKGYNSQHMISSLPRRAKDLRDGFRLGELVKCEWAPECSEYYGFKEYFIAEQDRQAVMEKIINELSIKKTA